MSQSSLLKFLGFWPLWQKCAKCSGEQEPLRFKKKKKVEIIEILYEM